MRQTRLEDYPELRPAVEAVEAIQARIREFRVRNWRKAGSEDCTCFCHSWDDDEWPYPDCPNCECATLPAVWRPRKYGGTME